MGKWNFNQHADDERMAGIDKIRSKRRKLKQASKEADSFVKAQDQWILGGEEKAFVARVVEVQKKYAFVSPEPSARDIHTRDVWLGTVARRYLTPHRKERNLVAVGDLVLCKPDSRSNADGHSDLPHCIMTQLAPRVTRIVRQDPMTQEREHVLASNIDQLVVVASYLRPKARFRLIDRFLVLAEEQDIPVVLIFNKADLLEEEASDAFRKTCHHYVELYQGLGYKVCSISSLQLEKSRGGSEWQALKDIFVGKISVLAGHSGVGKSSVVNLFKPEIEQVVEEDPNIFYKGRHTTTYASFIRLGTGGFVVDTPGVRSFLLAEREVIGLSHCFREFRPLMAQCKFRECRHIDEPGCAVLDALIKGDIDENRYRSYLAILSGESSREGTLAHDED